VHGYPVAGRVCNPMWDVSQHLPVYTKTNKSKIVGSQPVGIMFVKVVIGAQCLAPKLIVLQRYPYQGPYYSEQEAHDNSSK
jgi:hypothetical protein